MVSRRVLNGGDEPLRSLTPFGSLFVRFDRNAPPKFDDCVQEAVAGVEQGILILSSPERTADVVRQILVCKQVAWAEAEDMKNFTKKHTRLSLDQLAAVRFYTMETDPASSHDSFYALVNKSFRSEERARIKPLCPFLWLFMTALNLCPVHQGVVHRGIRGDLAAEYPEKRVITWNQLSSCTEEIKALENDSFMGKSGDRMLFTIEITSNRARSISEYSDISQEAEVILPPASRFQVLALFSQVPVWGTESPCSLQLYLVDDESSKEGY